MTFLKPLFLSLAVCLSGQAALPPVICPAGGPVGAVELSVRSPRGQGDTKPLRTINRLEEGDVIVYKPVLRNGEQRKGEVTVVLVPTNPATPTETLLILDPQKAKEAAEWEVPRRIGVVGFVYGPAGLSRKKVRSFLERDNELIAQLADYAEKTAQAEALIAALASPASSVDSVQSALRGFSGQYGFNVQLNRDAPPDQQALMLFRTLNPAISQYDPINTPQRTQIVAQTAGLATSVAALFFGNPVSLAAGGTAMLLQLGAMAFPNAEFRSTFAQSLPGDGMALCGQRHSPPPHTKVAYIWAARIPNTDPPSLTLRPGVSAAVGVRSPLPVAAEKRDWDFADRALNWRLTDAEAVVTPIRVTKFGPEGKLELDIPESLPPGDYKLSADWDWRRFEVQGDVAVRRLPGLQQIRLTPESHDRLVAGSGKQALTLVGTDFEFVMKMEIARPDDKFFQRSAVPFVLPNGLREGPQDKVDLQIQTDDLEAGVYKLEITQVDGRTRPFELNVLSAPPVIANLPVLLNQGARETRVVLRGERLDQIQKIDLPRASVELSPTVAGARQREAIVRVNKDIPAGTTLAAKAFWKDRQQPSQIPNAVRISNPLPTVVEASVSHDMRTGVELAAGELPGGSYVSASLRVDNLQPDSTLRLSCEQQNSSTVALKLGQNYGGVSLQQVDAGQLFLSFDTGVWLNACRLQAVVVNPQGESIPYYLGRIVRAPRIEQIEYAGETILTGQSLEMIERIGWSPGQAEAVTALPHALGADTTRQKLVVCLPAPPDGGAQLHVWLRGEESPRLARIGS